MDQEDIQALYDEGYVAGYDERFLLGPAWARLGAEFEEELIGELLGEAEARPSRWLDVACGTGWFLSRFPEVERAGLDLSPAMVAQAQAANPAITIREGSFLDPHPDWVSSWDLVSCMWFAYGYVDTVDEVEAVIANLARWTRPGGTCFVPVGDLRDLTGGIDVPFRNDETWTFGGPLLVVATVWSWTDTTADKQHRRLVAPHLDQLALWFEEWFEAVEVVHYPPLHPGWGGRRALVGRRRRAVQGAGSKPERSERVEAYRPVGTTDEVEVEVDPVPVDPVGDTIEVEPAGPKRPAGREGGLWVAWDRLPPVVRRLGRSAWAVLPVRTRRRVGAGMTAGESEPGDSAAT